METVKSVEMIQFGSLFIQFGEKDTSKTRHAKKQLGICSASSITLVKTTDECNVLIGTGFRNEMDLSEANQSKNEGLVKNALCAHDVEPDGIQEIFITHLHHDHFGNVRLFPNAVIRMAGVADEEVSFHRQRIKQKEEATRAPQKQEGESMKSDDREHASHETSIASLVCTSSANQGDQHGRIVCIMGAR